MLWLLNYASSLNLFSIELGTAKNILLKIGYAYTFLYFFPGYFEKLCKFFAFDSTFPKVPTRYNLLQTTTTNFEN